jgi:hypothetical protein
MSDCMTATECFAIPGHTMIDTIDSETGLTHIYRKTLEQVRAEQHTWADYSKAERMTIEAFCQSKAAAQDTPITWHPTTEEIYSRMLECLPPALWTGNGFLVGEPYDHHAITGQPRFQAFLKRGNDYLKSNRPITKAEFRAL